jgi:hypothetical protein
VMRQHIASTVDLIETYDPATQMVVAAVCGPQFLTTTFVVPLEAPVIVDEADGVH